MSASGKVQSLLQGLADFPDPAQSRSPFLQLVTLFGRTLERAEGDLYAVLRAHHVETADNLIGRGYLAPLTERGDLDRILALYLEVLGGTSQLVRVSPVFTARSFDVRRLARELGDPDHAFGPLLRRPGRGEAGTESALWGALRRYAVENTRVAPAEIRPGFVVDVMLGRSAPGRYLAGRLTPDTRRMLERYGGGEVDPALREALAAEINERVLPDPGLYRRLRPHFDGLPLPPAANRLRIGIYRGPDADGGAGMVGEAEVVPSPAGDDLRRLNRMLLESAYGSGGARPPWALPERRIPSLPELQELLAARFNELLRDPSLPADPALAPLAGRLPALRARYGAAGTWLNRALLEAAFPAGVEPSHAPYRERLVALIEVLRRGASTRRGIVDVVAANLGIVGDDPETRRARARIQVEEFAPRQRTFWEGDVGFWQRIEIATRHAEAVAPEIRVTVLRDAFGELANVRFTDLESSEWVRFPGRLRPGDSLVIKGRSVLLNGLTPAASLLGTVPQLRGRAEGEERRISTWRFDADVVVPGSEAGRERELPVARWSDTSSAEGLYGATVFAPGGPVVRVEVLSYDYTPGRFRVVIPYHIPGFTDKFAEVDHPRQQIQELVRRVQAAGVRSGVAYWQSFTESHELGATLAGALRSRVSEDQAPRDELELYGSRGAAESHALADSLSVPARFDHLAFDGVSVFS